MNSSSKSKPGTESSSPRAFVDVGAGKQTGSGAGKIPMSDRMAAFFRAVDVLALEMNLEVEFLMHTSGGWMASDRPVIEFVSTDTHEYEMFDGGRIFGEKR